MRCGVSIAAIDDASNPAAALPSPAANRGDEFGKRLRAPSRADDNTRIDWREPVGSRSMASFDCTSIHLAKQIHQRLDGDLFNPARTTAIGSYRSSRPGPSFYRRKQGIGKSEG
jgi:hypothetical protein